MQLYLDCDGVLADFDRGAGELLGMPPRAYERKYGIAAFWRAIARHGDFYATLPLMPDAIELFEAVRHLVPVILTGIRVAIGRHRRRSAGRPSIFRERRL